MADADVRYEERAGTLVVTVAGEVDMSNADDLRAAVQARMATHSQDLVVDLTDLEYIDSAGIHFIFVLRRRLTARGQRMQVIAPPGSPAGGALRYAGVVDELGPPTNA